MNIYSFYNNKGGVGKTTLCSNIAAAYAEKHPERQVLVVDMCPQANISQFLLGGGVRGHQANQQIQTAATRKNIVGFTDWLLKGNAGFTRPNTNYGIQVHPYNPHISENVYLIAGDSFLESLSLALNYAVLNPANTNAWQEFMTAIRRLCESEHEHRSDDYDDIAVFIDCNPSFSIYTQMALVSSDYLVVPMMADYSSAEGVTSIFTILYGVYPSAALQRYAQNVVTFSKQVKQFGLTLPTIFELVFNNYTANLGVAKAFQDIRSTLSSTCYRHFQDFPTLFAAAKHVPRTQQAWANTYLANVKDFHSAGKISSALGIPLHRLPERKSYKMPNGRRVTLQPERYQKSVDEMAELVDQFL